MHVDDTDSTDLQSPEIAPSRFPTRLIALVIAHILLMALATAVLFIPLDYLPFLGWTHYCIATAQWTLLSFWIALGFKRFRGAFLTALAGVIYLASPSLAILSVSQFRIGFPEPFELANLLLMLFVIVLIRVALFTGGFFALRLKVAALERLRDAAVRDQSSKWQFSIRHLFALTMATAALMGTTHYLPNILEAVGPEYEMLSAMAVTQLIVLPSALCAVWATLSLGRIRWRIALALAVSLLIGSASVRELNDLDVGERLNFMLNLPCATIIVIASLLVVRSCGYRLVPLGAKEMPAA